MTRYFFDAIGGLHVIDIDGELLPSQDAAMVVAADVVSEMTRSRVTPIWSGQGLTVRVRTAEGVIGSITVSASWNGDLPQASLAADKTD